MSIFEDCISYIKFKSGVPYDLYNRTWTLNTFTEGSDRFDISSSALIGSGTGYLSNTDSMSGLLANNSTISCWYKNNASTRIYMIDFQRYTGNMLYKESSGYPIYYRRYSSDGYDTITGTTAINDGNWHMVTATFSTASGSVLYVDGISCGTASTLTATYEGSENYNVIGANYARTSYCLNGSIDDVGIWKRTFSADEVKGLYQISSKKYIAPFQRGERWCDQ